LHASTAFIIGKDAASQVLTRKRRAGRNGLTEIFWELKHTKGDQPWEFEEPPFEEAYESVVEAGQNKEEDVEALQDCTEDYRESFEKYDNLMEVGDPEAARPLYSCTIAGKPLNLDHFSKKWWLRDPKVFNKFAEDKVN